MTDGPMEGAGMANWVAIVERKAVRLGYGVVREVRGDV